MRRELYQRAVAALRKGAPAFEAWREHYPRALRDVEADAVARYSVVIEATSRALIHPASNASVTDGAVLLHHTYGVPYLPGSGLKGIARAWMRRTVDLEGRRALQERFGERWKDLRSDARDQDIVRALFGSIPREGDEESVRAEGAVVEFLDALWIPEAPAGTLSDWSPLSLDVINPHQSAYYTGTSAPADTNEPVPTHRLTVSPGARFLVAVESVTREADAWAKYALERLLVPALTSMGFGAWTSAGYGRFVASGEVKHTAASVWHDVMVSLDPGSGRLSAALPGSTRRIAEAINPHAAALRATLSAELQERLKKKRALKLRVRAEKFGNAWWIVAIKA